MTQKLYFTRDEILMGREVSNPLTREMEENLNNLILAISKVREKYNKPLKVSSGYRPLAANKAAGGAKASAHMSCQAVDIADKDGLFGSWCLNNVDVLKECGILGLEDVRYTMVIDKNGEVVNQWTHLQIRPTSSGNIVFIPYAGPIKLKVA